MRMRMNDRGALGSGTSQLRRSYLYGIFPDSHERPPGLLANLQESRATEQVMIKRNNGHAPIFGATIHEVKPCRLSAAYLSLSSSHGSASSDIPHSGI